VESFVNVSLTISIDAMGGDHGTKVTVPASLDCLKNNPDLKLILVGDEAVLKPLLAQALAD
jgi:glycerol-3-phosphate acyltransferase PlsX